MFTTAKVVGKGVIGVAVTGIATITGFILLFGGEKEEEKDRAQMQRVTVPKEPALAVAA